MTNRKSNTVSPSMLAKLLAATIPAGENVLITGAPGLGKSSIVEQACDAAGADLIISHPVTADPTDAKGLPWKCEGRDAATFLPFGDLERALAATKRTVWFLDDLGQATPAVQASFMQLILARRVNGHTLPNCITFVAATNRRSDRAGVSGILEPVKSRFATIVELEAHLDDWRRWAIQSGIDPRVIAYLSFRPGQLHDFRPSPDMTNSPCPRTWAAASRMLQLGLEPALLMPALSGALGDGTAIEFVAFLQLWHDMPNPDAILMAPDAGDLPTRPEVLYAIVVALATRVNATCVGAFCRYLERLVKDGRGEFAALGVNLMLTREPRLANTPDFVRAAVGPIGDLIVGNQ